MSAIVLVERLAPGTRLPEAAEVLSLPLTADQRSSCRGHRRTACGRDLVLQLPRGAALVPGDLLASANRQWHVRVQAAPEPLLRVRSSEPLALLQAAYHLGNRHVAMELHADRLLLPQDSVLEDLLCQRGLLVERLLAPFQPEAGAYEGLGHRHSHSHSHSHG